MHKPLIAVTMGDPAGVGPEVIAKALSKPESHGFCVPFVVGDYGVMERAVRLAAPAAAHKLGRIASLERLEPFAGAVQVLDLANVPAEGFRYGTVRAEYGRAAGEAIERAARLALEGRAGAVVTAPIQKESFKAAGYPHPGHTEMLAALTGAKRVTLMLMRGDFRVVHVTLHVPLREVASAVTEERVFETVRTAHEGCLALGIARPRVAVAGLNPHAGDGGLFGDEEARVIRPAVERARSEGIAAEGPFSPDTVFAMLRGGRFDIAVAMYHDQGGIAMKLLSFDWDPRANRWGKIAGVNVTLGLPIVRVSVSHGTAFEAAGKGTADASSLEEAGRVAARMAETRHAAASRGTAAGGKP
jgi:4-hydroxythreonine-4-phosphate dehydrogenase